MNASEIVEFYLENDILISPELLDELHTDSNIVIPTNTEFVVLNKDILSTLHSTDSNKSRFSKMKHSDVLDIESFEKALVLKEKRKNPKMYDMMMDHIKNINTSATTGFNNITNIPNTIDINKSSNNHIMNDGEMLLKLIFI